MKISEVVVGKEYYYRTIRENVTALEVRDDIGLVRVEDSQKYTYWASPVRLFPVMSGDDIVKREG